MKITKISKHFSLTIQARPFHPLTMSTMMEAEVGEGETEEDVRALLDEKVQEDVFLGIPEAVEKFNTEIDGMTSSGAIRKK